MTTINSIELLVLDLPPSCIEFCPAAPSYFVVGTYLLEQKTQGENATQNTSSPEAETGEAQKRSGSLVVFKLEEDRM